MSMTIILAAFLFGPPSGPPSSLLAAASLAIGSATGGAAAMESSLNASPAAPAQQLPAAVTGQYNLSGTKALRPVRITDDGVHTYLEWGQEQELPAVFALNALGEEEVVDGYMRAGLFTIDRVNSVLMFRIGKKTAKAVRRRD